MDIKQIIIGLEVHVELKTKSKMFCGCPADHFGKPPNTQTCPVCLALPGALPVPNQKAIEEVILFGLAIGGEIMRQTNFDRKNYFYPDLPKGYQISQYDQPLVKNGRILLDSGKVIQVTRVHLEEDTAKLIHKTTGRESFTLIDFNRSGVPLMEVVSEPDLRSAQEAKEYLEKIRQLVRYIDISDADMEKGSLRCEPNVNLVIDDNGKTIKTPIAEIKNINSFNFAKKAIDYEVVRQFKEYQKNHITKSVGNKVTRGWDEKSGETVLQRTKEEASDYRYFPEPDIPPIVWDEKNLKRFKTLFSSLTLPAEYQKLCIEKYHLSSYQADIITQEKSTAEFFIKAVALGKKYQLPPILVANTIINKKVTDKYTPEGLVDLIVSKRQENVIPKEEIEKRIIKIVKSNPDVLFSYRKGRIQSLGVIVGAVKKDLGIVVQFKEIENIIKKYF